VKAEKPGVRVTWNRNMSQERNPRNAQSESNTVQMQSLAFLSTNHRKKPKGYFRLFWITSVCTRQVTKTDKKGPDARKYFWNCFTNWDSKN